MNHYTEPASEESDRKEDAMENHSRYQSSDVPEPEMPNDEAEVSQNMESDKGSIFKIIKHKSIDEKEKSAENVSEQEILEPVHQQKQE